MSLKEDPAYIIITCSSPPYVNDCRALKYFFPFR